MPHLTRTGTQLATGATEVPRTKSGGSSASAFPATPTRSSPQSNGPD